MHARHLNIVDVGGRTGDEPGIFLPPNRLANQLFGVESVVVAMVCS